MSRLTDLIQEAPDPILAILHIIIDPTTKKEATDQPRQASVIGGPRLSREPDESSEAFEARVMFAAKRLRGENEQVN